MWVDGVSTVVFAWLCYQALVNRRNPALHGGYLLATPLPLIMAVVTRLPLHLVASGTPLPARFHPGFNLAIVVMLLCAVALWRWQPRHPAPFVTIGIATLLEWAGYISPPQCRAGRRWAWQSPRRPHGWSARLASGWGLPRCGTAGPHPFAVVWSPEPLKRNDAHVDCRRAVDGTSPRSGTRQPVDGYLYENVER